MPRIARIAPAGMVFHVLNRRVDRKTLFYTDSDYRAFEMVLEEVVALVGIRLCAYCLMPNHVHLILVPPEEDALRRALRAVREVEQSGEFDVCVVDDGSTDGTADWTTW